MQSICVNSSNSWFLFPYAPCVPWLNPTQAVLFEYFEYFVVSKISAVLRAAPHSELRTQVSVANETLNHGVSHTVVSNPIKPFKIKVLRSFYFRLFPLFLFVYFVYFVVSNLLKPFKIRVSSTFRLFTGHWRLATFHWSAALFLWF